jgi:hypothetical protein
MTDKILLYVSSAQVLFARWSNGKLTRCELLAPDESGIAAFTALLGTAGRLPLYVVADTVEEDYRFETLPHATGADRLSLIERKIRHYYRNTRYVSTLFRGRIGDKRRDDRYLFSALTNPALIDPWLAAIAEYGSPIAGIYLAPMLTAGIMAKLKLTQPRVLIAAPHRSGLRLTFYKDGQFCSSRLTRVIPRDVDDATRMLATELSNTRLYLSTMHLDAIDETLNVVFLDRNDRLAAAAAHITADGHGLDCTCIDRATLLQQLQVSPQQLDLALESIYLSVLAETPPEANLAPASITAGFQLLKRKRTLYAVAAGVALAGVAWSGYNVWHGYDLGQQAADAAQRTAAAQMQYREITRTFPAAPTSSDNLIKAVNVYHKVVKAVRSPQPFLQIISRAMDAHPEIFLQEITWNYDTQRLETGIPAAPGGTPPAAASSIENLHQSGMLSGEVRPFHGDFRAAIAAINRVAEHLARDPAVADVKVVKMPLNVNPETALTGDTRDAAEHTGAAEFKIELTLKPNA